MWGKFKTLRAEGILRVVIHIVPPGVAVNILNSAKIVYCHSLILHTKGLSSTIIQTRYTVTTGQCKAKLKIFNQLYLTETYARAS